MIEAKYKKSIKQTLAALSPKSTRAFIFGSSITSDNFADIDVGILNKKMDANTLQSIKDAFEKSNIPYNIDIVHIDRANKAFQKKVLKGEILWLMQKKN